MDSKNEGGSQAAAHSVSYRAAYSEGTGGRERVKR